MIGMVLSIIDSRSEYAEASRLHHRVIGIALGSRCVERIHIRRVHGRAGFPSRHQIRIGNKRPSHGNEIAFACGQIAFGTFGIVTAGENQCAFEQLAEMSPSSSSGTGGAPMGE